MKISLQLALLDSSEKALSLAMALVLECEATLTQVGENEKNQMKEVEIQAPTMNNKARKSTHTLQTQRFRLKVTFGRLLRIFINFRNSP